jgi:hypothetical protein
VNRNPFEESARAKKAIALLGALDRQAALAGLPPLAGVRGIETVRALSKRDWAALAREAGVRPPSAAAVELVVEAIEARRGPRKATPPPQVPLFRTKAS